MVLFALSLATASYKFVDERGSAPVPMLAAVFACALASYYIVEKPARGWLNRNW